jgi:hypothetical protein
VSPAAADLGLRDISRGFTRAWADGDDDTAVPELLPVRLASACLAVLPVSGAGLSLLKGEFRVPLGASDANAGIAERLQFTRGAGPCLEAARNGRMIVSVGEDLEQRWPVYAEDLADRTPYRAVISLPLPLTAAFSGALDLYLEDVADVRAVRLADAAVVTDDIVSALLLAQGIHSARSDWTDRPEPAWMHSAAAVDRTNVWIAMGMVMTRHDLFAPDALATLRAYAFAHDSDLDRVAAGLLDGTLDVDAIAG